MVAIPQLIMRYLFGLIILLNSWSLHAWNMNGHKLVMQIAYDLLSPAQRHQLNTINYRMDKSFACHSLIAASFWLDTLHNKPEFDYLSTVHYIDIPYSPNTRYSLPTQTPNALTALQTTFESLKNKKDDPYQQGLDLRVLVHLLGDIHQPLHTITYLSSSHPEGDRGGNLFLLKKNAVAKNLHAYWDRGGGYLNKRFSYHKVKREAKKLSNRYPCILPRSINFLEWIQQSHHLAVNQVYTISPIQRPNKEYRFNAQRLSQYQIATAGCRLYAVLSQILQ